MLGDVLDGSFDCGCCCDLVFGGGDHLSLQRLLSGDGGFNRGECLGGHGIVRLHGLAIVDLLGSGVLVLHIDFAIELGLGGLGGRALDNGAII